MILVTGGTGYIGSHTVVELLQQDYDVLVLDSLENSSRSVLETIKQITSKEVAFEEIDLRDFDATNAVFKNYPIKSVIHFAAYKSVGESVEHPLAYYNNNVTGLINLLKCCELNKVKDFIFSSSCTVYGQPAEAKIGESTAIARAMSPYGNTKIICEDIIRDYSVSCDFNAILLRYFNPIGSHESFLLGDVQEGRPNNLLPYITKVAQGDLDCLNVFGGDYNTKDGTCVRDYIHVVDVAQAHVKALEYINKNGEVGVEPFNLGTGEGSTVLEIIGAFEEATGMKVKYEVVERRPGDVEAVYADPIKAEEILKWTAKLGLKEMMVSAWEFYKRNSKGE